MAKKIKVTLEISEINDYDLPQTAYRVLISVGGSSTTQMSFFSLDDVVDRIKTMAISELGKQQGDK